MKGGKGETRGNGQISPYILLSYNAGGWEERGGRSHEPNGSNLSAMEKAEAVGKAFFLVSAPIKFWALSVVSSLEE